MHFLNEFCIFHINYTSCKYKINFIIKNQLVIRVIDVINTFQLLEYLVMLT